ncbi:MAG: 4Fe-4S double cluster binding domain-containing protein [Candidatus Hermodarchaeota archaeon]
MTINKVRKEIFIKLDEKGYQGRIVSAKHIDDIRADIEKRHQQNQFDQEFYQERISVFKYNPSTLSEINSIIIVAVPQRQIRVNFTWHEKTVSLIIPPTYIEEMDKKVEEILEEILISLGYHVTRAKLPLKLLAVYSGLAKYGRNNISYIPGLGSFHRLVAFYSNLPCGDDNWQKLQMMKYCQKCSACLRKCPTNAITPIRFLLRAERCITFLNEKPGNISFPDWLEPSWHNCLIGCLHCQTICPVNKKYLSLIEQGTEFSE